MKTRWQQIYRAKKQEERNAIPTTLGIPKGRRSAKHRRLIRRINKIYGTIYMGEWLSLEELKVRMSFCHKKFTGNEILTPNEVRMVIGFPVGTTVLKPIPGVTITCAKKGAKDENRN